MTLTWDALRSVLIVVSPYFQQISRTSSTPTLCATTPIATPTGRSFSRRGDQPEEQAVLSTRRGPQYARSGSSNAAGLGRHRKPADPRRVVAYGPGDGGDPRR